MKKTYIFSAANKPMDIRTCGQKVTDNEYSCFRNFVIINGLSIPSLLYYIRLSGNGCLLINSSASLRLSNIIYFLTSSNQRTFQS